MPRKGESMERPPRFASASTPAPQDLDAQVAFLVRGTDRVISADELRRKLHQAAQEGRPLRVKLGIDPTAPDLHLGHAVVLRKLRDFQDLGHRVTLVIGDFTGRIGDPTGKSETRRQLSAGEVASNAETYVRQMHKILDPDRTDITYNSQWLGPLDFAAVLDLASKATVARVLERDDFSTRYREGRPIHLHEFFYALMQGYDSVALRADVELGGTDQTFNLMMAREIQRDYGQPPEVAVITPLLVGLDGQQKMSKSLGNTIGIDEPPGEMFGKVMSVPDALIGTYLLTCTRLEMAEVEAITSGIERGSVHPRDAKLRLGEEIVATYHSREEARKAREEFIAVFSRGTLPEDIPEVRWLGPSTTRAMDLVAGIGAAPSKSEARRLLRQGAVELDGQRLDDPAGIITVNDGSTLRVGKRGFYRLRLV